jgi:hypothetical protein
MSGALYRAKSNRAGCSAEYVGYLDLCACRDLSVAHDLSSKETVANI